MARDPQRIEPILALIRGVWHMYPDQRLCQLLRNISLSPTFQEFFNMEDDELAAALGRVLRSGL